MEKINFGINVNDFEYLNSIKNTVDVIQLYSEDLNEKYIDKFNTCINKETKSYTILLNKIILSLFGVDIFYMKKNLLIYKFIIIHIPHDLVLYKSNVKEYTRKLSVFINIFKEIENILHKKIYINIHISYYTIELYEKNTNLYNLIYNNLLYFVAEFVNMNSIEKDKRLNFINRINTMFDNKLLICLDTKHIFKNLKEEEITEFIKDIHDNKTILNNLFCIHLNDFKNISIFDLFQNETLKYIYELFYNKINRPIILILERHEDNYNIHNEIKKIKNVLEL